MTTCIYQNISIVKQCVTVNENFKLQSAIPDHGKLTSESDKQRVELCRQILIITQTVVTEGDAISGK